MDETQAQIVGVVVALVCFLCAGIITLMFLRRRRKLATWVTAQATVSRSWRERRGDAYAGGGGNVYFAEYIFALDDGQKRQGKGRTDEEHQPNDVIEIRYNPEDPYESQAAFTDSALWYVVGVPAVLMFLALGVLALLDGLAVVDLS